MFVGIDPSYGGLAIVIKDEDRTHDWVRSFPLAKYSSSTERLAIIENEVFNVLTIWDGLQEHVCMEGYSRGSSQRREEAGEVSAACRIALYNSWTNPVVPVFVSPSQVKKFATGKGTASKQEVMSGVKEKWGYQYDNDNLADAFVLATISEMLFLERDSPLAYQQEVLDRLRG